MVMLGFLLRFMRVHPSILVSVSIVLFLQLTTTTTTGEVVELVEMEIEHGRWQRIALATVEPLVRPYVSNCQSGAWIKTGGSLGKAQTYCTKRLLAQKINLGVHQYCSISTTVQQYNSETISCEVTGDTNQNWFLTSNKYTYCCAKCI